MPENHNHDIHRYDKPTFSVVLSNFICRKLRTVLTNRVLRFLHEKSTKDAAEFDKFYKDYGMFLKEGIVTANEQFEKASNFHSHVMLY
jgi:HSP90 family molecular chaperone